MQLRRLVIAVVVVLAPIGAQAHTSSSTYGEVRLEPRALRYVLELGPLETNELIGQGPYARLEEEQIRREAGSLGRVVAAHLTVTNNGRPCPGRAEKVDPQPTGARRTGVRVELRFECERRLEDVEIGYQLFFDKDPQHQSFTKAEVGGAVRQHLFRDTFRTWRISRDVPLWAHARDYAVLGVGHIFTGYDHILFLIALLLVAGVDGRTGAPRGLGRGIRYTVTIVTAFTVAHSVTLVAAALGWVSLPPRLFESAIALSIAWVAIENIAVREPRFRWLLTFGFGLVHGLGFASVLREIGLPRRGLIASLLSFNLGVEIGQIAIVAVLFPALHALASRGARTWYRPAVLVAGSSVVLAFALFWLVQRAAGIQLLGGRLGG